MNPLTSLPLDRLEALAAGLSSGALRYGITPTALRSFGLDNTIANDLSCYLLNPALNPDAAALLVRAVIDTKKTQGSRPDEQSLVITGPQPPGAHNLETKSRFLKVVESAKSELMLATYALYQGHDILSPIITAMERNPGLKVSLIINIARKWGDRTATSDIVAHYRHDFFKKHWKSDLRPEIYYYPEALGLDTKVRPSMHAKFLIADEKRSFITSANFTRAAQETNIEVGVELLHSQESKALSHYFKELISNRNLEQLL